MTSSGSEGPPPAEGCQIVLVNAGHEVLLQLRDDIPSIPFPGRWALPGGMLEPDERPADCIRREVAEELGIVLQPEEIEHLWSAHRSYGIEHTFTAALEAASEDIALTEGQRVAWFSLTQALALPLAYEDDVVLSASGCRGACRRT